MTLHFLKVGECIGYSTYILCVQPAEFLYMYIPMQLLPGQDRIFPPPQKAPLHSSPVSPYRSPKSNQYSTPIYMNKLQCF